VGMCVICGYVCVVLIYVRVVGVCVMC